MRKKAEKLDEEGKRGKQAVGGSGRETSASLQAVAFQDNRPEAIVQQKLQSNIDLSPDRFSPLQRQAVSSGGIVQRKKDYYAYGSANTTPHIHVYSGGDCHLKIFDRRRIRRYNIVQNGERHSQADTALAVAEGTPALVAAINGLLDGV